MQKAINFIEPDVVPVCPLYLYPSAELYGTTVKEYASNGKIMAECLLASQEKFKFDGITVGTDVTIEAEAVGSVVKQPLNSPAFVTKYKLEDIKNFDSLTIPDPYTAGRMPVVIDAVKQCAQKVGDQVYIIGLVQGPINIASQLRGVENLMMDFFDNFDFVVELFEYCIKLGNVFAKALVESGARCIQTGEALASPAFISPTVYKDFISVMEKKQHEEILSYGAESILVHICGQTISILDDAAETKASAIDLDSPVDMKEAKRILHGRMAMKGNIDSSDVLLRGTPDLVRQKTKEVIYAAGEGGGLIIGSGCDVCYGTPYENIQALVEATREFGQYPIMPA